jgi:hypothetical protein
VLALGADDASESRTSTSLRHSPSSLVHASKFVVVVLFRYRCCQCCCVPLLPLLTVSHRIVEPFSDLVYLVHFRAVLEATNGAAAGALPRH